MVEVSVGQLARASLAISMAVSLTALLLAFLKPQAHMILASTAISITFPLTVYIPFLAGLKGGSPRRGFEGLSAIASVTLAMLTPLIALILSYRLALVIGALGILVALYFALLQIRGRREPFILFAYPLLAGFIGLMYSALQDSTVVQAALITAMSFTTPLIFTVSTISMSRNYRVPLKPAKIYIPLVLNILGLTAFTYSKTAGLSLLTLFLLSHFIAIGYYNFPGLLRIAESSTPLFRSVTRYIVLGHTTAFISVILLAYHIVVGARDIVLVHDIYMGFIGAHVYLHTPLMVPFMMGIKSSRRYNPTPFVLLLLAAILRALSPDLSYLVLLLSLIALSLTIKP
jgi:hypothetical protein